MLLNIKCYVDQCGIEDLKLNLDCRELLKMSGEGKGDEGGRTRTPPPVDEGPLEPVNGVVYPPTNPPAAR